ncbi:WD domain, G-beta repeat [Gemmata obscuriglobus]|uniref:WD40 repeat domain-containing protein n=1 Tax=Gemmata obscuriglobus TaxID=114 RepID=A0A2Z3HE31_9BACT|nr:WD40 repeat domain-containing protein [Gemmata obscuriglobus]AWM41857.1 WD40 repeat domain-containing protein [Gemmata obscuriglobus]QEG32175.1 WD domain, G-beta repeat [Gemmata obscuriglobus]VTS11528.1 wd40 repeat-containing protein : NACHT and WD40 domain protein (AFU_orthologue AFUA_7G08500) OS=Emericella nidulans (strain FGSC A4 / ATCC 38163 / CBS 112.46 / NRRL 194 / M139) GN=AN8468.2 PE=4 SV=1: PD40: WD40 [Gemmata obscuriglobus UQM 2246]
MLIWKAHSRPIDALAFTPDGHALALSGYYLACKLIDPITGARLWTAETNSAVGLSLAFVPDGVLCRQGGLSVLDRNTGGEIRRFGDRCQSFAPAPDGRAVFVAGTRNDRLGRYDLSTGTAGAEVELASGAVNRLAASSDGKWLAAVGCKRFYLLAADTLEERASESHRALSSGSFALALSPDGRFLVYSAGREMFVREVPECREIAGVQLAAKPFMDAAFSPDGRSLFTASKEGAVRVYSTTSWELEKSFDWGIGPLRAIAVSPDGTRAAAAGDAGRVVVWDLEV